MDENFACLQEFKQYLQSRIDLRKIEPEVNYYIPQLSSAIAHLDSESKPDFYDKLSKSSYETFNIFLNILKESNYGIEAEWLESKFQRPLHYEMNKKSIGLCLIINNMEFDPQKKQSDKAEIRVGSDEDEKALTKTFQTIGYEFMHRKDLTAKEMEKALLEFRNHLNGDFDYDSCIVIILSHGSNSGQRDFVCGKDWNHLYKENVYDMFNDKECLKMQGKPKMFFFQACRGEQHYSCPAPDKFLDALPGAEPVYIPVSTAPSQLQSTISDMVVVHSALPNHKCHHRTKGSTFCQTLAKVFKRDYKKHDLNAMLVTVSKEMKNIPGKEEFIHIEYLGNFGIVNFHNGSV